MSSNLTYSKYFDHWLSLIGANMWRTSQGQRQSFVVYPGNAQEPHRVRVFTPYGHWLLFIVKIRSKPSMNRISMISDTSSVLLSTQQNVLFLFVMKVLLLIRKVTNYDKQFKTAVLGKESTILNGNWTIPSLQIMHKSEQLWDYLHADFLFKGI